MIQHAGHSPALALAGRVSTGLLAFAIAAIAFIHPGWTTVLVIAFAVLAIVDALVAAAEAVRGAQSGRPEWGRVGHVVAGLVLGVLTLAAVHKIVTLTWTIGTWAIVLGLIAIAVATVVHHDRLHLVVGGVIAIVLGIGLIVVTRGGFIAPGYVVGFFGLAWGIYAFAGPRATIHHHALPSGSASGAVTPR